MAQQRRLAAIMFTDIVNYTKLMGEDEDKAFEFLRLNRSIQKPLIEKYSGTFIKELGDGTLSTFQTVTDSVLCAIEIQNACNEKAAFKLRIGIHSGEIIFEDDDVFGDGVNIASRLQTQAPAGGICISETVCHNINNKNIIATRFLREEKLKNVQQPVKIYEVILNGKQNAGNNKATMKPTPEKSIAVLPFINMSNDPEQDFFSEGVAEEIFNSLAHLTNLKVAGRTSSFQFKGRNIDLREVGEKLNVSTVLEGSVRKQQNRLRITVQLVNVDDGYNLWSEKYDREIDDIFAIQDDIALAVAEKLKITLLEKDVALFDKKPTESKEAYELYLKGRFYLNRRGRFIWEGLKYFQQAINLDDQFALPYAGYADAILLLALYNFLPAKEVMPKAKFAAEKAIQLDSTRSEPYTSLGFYYSYFEWDKKKGNKYFTKALQINPSYAQGQFWYALYYLAWIECDFQKAEEQMKIALNLEPIGAIVYAIHSCILYTSNKYEAAIQAAIDSIELDPNSFLAYNIMGLSYIELRKLEEAKQTINRCLELTNRGQWPLNFLIWINCLSGNLEEAAVIMNEIKSRTGKENICYTYLALSAGYMGNIDEAFEMLEKAFDNIEPVMLTMRIKNIPGIPEAVRKDPRFAAFLKKIVFRDDDN